ncbi:MAG: DsbA family oxidoreductase [Alphaproteobacteria bacterium]|nr:MAG: DsbA family oxidoreductase [Alphaproteobacteria bacterium]
MHINIISDTVCPWCYLGKAKFERALEAFRAEHPEEDVTVTWRPFQLDPSLPKQGVDRKAYYRAKFGDNPQVRATGERIRDMGSALGITFNFDDIKISPNTLDSHRLIRWAQSADCQDAVVTALFKAYFEEGRNIGDPEVLAEIAQANGMDGDLVTELLSQNADEDLVRKDDMLAREMGVSGVPVFIIDQRFPIQGAQEPDTILHFLNRALDVRKKEELAQSST